MRFEKCKIKVHRFGTTEELQYGQLIRYNQPPVTKHSPHDFLGVDTSEPQEVC